MLLGEAGLGDIRNSRNELHGILYAALIYVPCVQFFNGGGEGRKKMLLFPPLPFPSQGGGCWDSNIANLFIFSTDRK